MKKLSVPFNQDPALIDFYIEHKDSINDMYFPAYPGIFRDSARAFTSDITESNHTEMMGYICQKLAVNNIKPILLFNANNKYGMPTEEEAIRVRNYLNFLISKGLYGVTVSDPFIIPFLKEFPLVIRSSVLFDTYNEEKVRHLKKIGVEEVCLKNDLCRDIKTLRRIRESTDLQLSIICNTTCTFSCVFYHAHHAVMSNTQIKADYEYANIHEYMLSAFKDGLNPIKAPFIRPEDMWYFDDCIDVFKIEGRQRDTGGVIKFTLPYILRKTPEEGLLSIISPSCGVNSSIAELITDIPEDFVEVVSNCDRNCDVCGYCDKIVKTHSLLNANIHFV